MGSFSFIATTLIYLDEQPLLILFTCMSLASLSVLYANTLIMFFFHSSLYLCSVIMVYFLTMASVLVEDIRRMAPRAMGRWIQLKTQKLEKDFNLTSRGHVVPYCVLYSLYQHLHRSQRGLQHC